MNADEINHDSGHEDPPVFELLPIYVALKVLAFVLWVIGAGYLLVVLIQFNSSVSKMIWSFGIVDSDAFGSPWFKLGVAAVLFLCAWGTGRINKYLFG